MSNEELRGRFRRDFTQGPIRQQVPQAPKPVPQTIPQQTTKPVAAPQSIPRPIPSATPHSAPKSRARGKIFIIVFALIVAAAGGSAYWYKYIKLSSPVPAYISSSVDFPLLYPTKLPTSYHISKTSFSSSNGIVIYQAEGSGPGHIVFTVQKRPPTFDFDTFYKQGLTKSTVFTTPLGQAAIGIANGAQVGSLATDKSWILVNPVSTNIQSDGLRLILENMKQTAGGS